MSSSQIKLAFQLYPIYQAGLMLCYWRISLSSTW